MENDKTTISISELNKLQNESWETGFNCGYNKGIEVNKIFDEEMMDKYRKVVDDYEKSVNSLKDLTNKYIELSNKFREVSEKYINLLNKED